MQGAVGVSDTQFIFRNAVKYDGTNIDATDFGDVQYGTIDPKTAKQEALELTFVSNVAGVMTCNIARARKGVTPYAAGGIAYAHEDGAVFVFSNSAALFDRLSVKENAETITGSKNFTGNNSHSGIETFTGQINVPVATTNTEAVQKKYVDDGLALKANDIATVHKTGAENIDNVKTFTSPPIIPTATQPTEAVNKGQMEGYIAANSGSIKASTTAYGTTKLSVDPAVANEPKAVGDNDPRMLLAGSYPGMVSPFAGSTTPSGWLLCDGSAVSRTTYSALFTAISTIYGVGDGSTTFNLPNAKGRVISGYDASQTEFNTLGKTGGEKTHVLTTTEMPSHRHFLQSDTVGTGNNAQAFSGQNIGLQGAYATYGDGVANITYTGNDGAHNNLQPYITMNYIIKT